MIDNCQLDLTLIWDSDPGPSRVIGPGSDLHLFQPCHHFEDINRFR
jgi:hypothetical protein